MVDKLLRLLLFTVLLLVFSRVSLHAQHRFGVTWDIPENSQAAVEQLRKFYKMGISVIEIKEQPGPVVWEEVGKLNLQVYGNLNIQFPITHTFAAPDSLFINKIETRASVFLSQPSVQAIGLFEFGPIHNSEFIHAVGPFIDQIKKAGNVEIYFISSRDIPIADKIADFFIYHQHITARNIESFELPDGDAINGYRFSVSSDLKNFFKPFSRFLKVASDQPQKTIFLDSAWLFSMAEEYPQLEQTLNSLINESKAVFPSPDEPLPENNQSSVPILILLLMWAATALVYGSNPLYRKSLFRYFIGHKFFVKDIFARHIRSPLPAIIIIFQNAVLLATGVFVAFSALFSSLGEKAFYYHFSTLSIFESGSFSLLIWTFFVVLAISLISILWLHIFLRNLSSITQIATIYAWPLQINLIVITIVISIFASGGSPTLMAGFTLIAFLIFLVSFNFTSADAARFLKTKSKLYFLITSGLYLVTIGALTGWLLTRESFWDIISLSLSLK